MRLSRNRHLRPNPASLGVIPLESGEASRPVRVRAKLEVFKGLAGLNPKEIGSILELALTARNALSRHFTKNEAQALIGKKVRFLVHQGPRERKGSTARVFNFRAVTRGEGFELELNTGLIVTKSNFKG